MVDLVRIRLESLARLVLRQKLSLPQLFWVPAHLDMCTLACAASLVITDDLVEEQHLPETAGMTRAMFETGWALHGGHLPLHRLKMPGSLSRFVFRFGSKKGSSIHPKKPAQGIL